MAVASSPRRVVAWSIDYGQQGSPLAMWIGLFEMAEKRESENANSPGVFGYARKQPQMFRAALYARVSNNDQQTLPMQSRALREYAARRG